MRTASSETLDWFARLAIAALGILTGFAFDTSTGFAQDRINPSDPPLFYEGKGNWGNWTVIPQHPRLSVRGACGDDSNLPPSDAQVFTNYSQIRSEYAYSIGLVWRQEEYDEKTRTNKMSAKMLTYIDPSRVTESIAVIGGNCSATKLVYVRIVCVAKKGDEGDACYKDAQGNPIPERTDQFRSRPPGNTSNVSKNKSMSNSSFVTLYWVCSAQYNQGAAEVVTPVFEKGIEPSRIPQLDDFRKTDGHSGVYFEKEFHDWLTTRHPISSYEITYAGCNMFRTHEEADEEFAAYRRTRGAEIVEWSPGS